MTHDEMIKVIQAHSSGKQIQCASAKRGNVWTDTTYPVWNFEDYTYRIKPEPKLRPWRPEEVPVGALIRGDWGMAVLTHMRGGCDPMFCAPDHTKEGRQWRVDQSHDLELEYSIDHGKTWLPCGVMEDAP